MCTAAAYVYVLLQLTCTAPLMCNAGEAFRAVSGLTLGYVLRPFFRVEQLLWPVYNWATKLIEPGAEYRVRVGDAQARCGLMFTLRLGGTAIWGA